MSIVTYSSSFPYKFNPVSFLKIRQDHRLWHLDTTHSHTSTLSPDISSSFRFIFKLKATHFAALHCRFIQIAALQQFCWQQQKISHKAQLCAQMKFLTTWWLFCEYQQSLGYHKALFFLILIIVIIKVRDWEDTEACIKGYILSGHLKNVKWTMLRIHLSSNILFFAFIIFSSWCIS